jgi:hypothetical protein
VHRGRGVRDPYYERAKYLTMFPIPGFEAEMSFGEVVAELRRQYPERVIPRFVAHDPRFMVFEIR